VVMEHLRTQGWHLQLPPQETLAAAPSQVPQGIDDQDSLGPTGGEEAPGRQQE
jgi:hypothetical protein